MKRSKRLPQPGALRPHPARPPRRRRPVPHESFGPFPPDVFNLPATVEAIEAGVDAETQAERERMTTVWIVGVAGPMEIQPDPTGGGR